MKPKSIFTAQRTASDGFIVVIVLWFLGALSALASIYSVYVINTAAGFAAYDDQLRTEALVSAALEVTAYQQLTQQPRPTSGQFSFHLGEANIAVEFQSEAARIDLNAAPKQFLIGLFRTLGAVPMMQKYTAIASSAGERPKRVSKIQKLRRIEWRGLGYQPRGAKFPHADELSLVRDIPSSLVERALPFVTVYSGRPQVNVLDAAPEVLAALPGMTSERLSALLAQREASPESAKALLPQEAQQYATLEGSKAFRVSIRVAFENGRQRSAEVVIFLFEAGDQPFAVLSWEDGLGPVIADNRQ